MNFGKRIGLFVTLVSVMVGCGAAPNAPRSPAAEASGPAPAAYKSSQGYAGDVDVQAAPPAPASEAPSGGRSASAEAPAQPSPQSRPGLGTEWGEARRSEVRDVSFVRADALRPFAMATLHYNDRAGVDALISLRDRQGNTSRELPTANGLVAVSVRDGSGDPLEAIRFGGRTYLIGQAGERYTLVVQNRSAHRFEAIATVDGLDVVNGQPGSLEHRGYVLNPHATLEIEGFRQSATQVATFRFGRVSDSYAAQTGSARNVGVIGVAFFSERGDSFNDDRDTRLRDTANPFPGSDPRYAPPPPRR